MSDPFIGEIKMFGGTFAPAGYMMCNGQLLPIQQYAALFSILGTTYGGNGTTTFALPDLRGRVPISQGQGPGLSNYILGEQTGNESVTLLAAQLPAHSHTVGCDATGTGKGGSAFGVGTGGTPANNIPGLATSPSHAAYSSNAPNAFMNGNMIGGGGSNQPHSNLQPLLCVTFIIAIQGVFPSRN